LPVCKVAVLGNLVSAEHGHVDPPAADQGEGIGVVHDCRARLQCDVLAAGINEVQILLARRGERAVADYPVLGMKDDLFIAEIGIRAQGRDADPEIDDPAVAEFHCQPVAHLLAGQPLRPLAHRPMLPGGCGHHPSGGGGILTIRCTKIPAVCTSSGSMAPTGRMSSSTSTTVIRAAI